MKPVFAPWRAEFVSPPSLEFPALLPGPRASFASPRKDAVEKRPFFLPVQLRVTLNFFGLYFSTIPSVHLSHLRGSGSRQSLKPDRFSPAMTFSCYFLYYLTLVHPFFFLLPLYFSLLFSPWSLSLPYTVPPVAFFFFALVRRRAPTLINLSWES